MKIPEPVAEIQLRSKAFSHMEQEMLENCKEGSGSSAMSRVNSSSGSEGDKRSLFQQKKGIDMDIIERIKSMRGQSKDPEPK